MSVNGIAKPFNISEVKRADIVKPAPHETVWLTEVVTGDDPRGSRFDDAKRREIRNLIDRGTVSVVLRPEADENPNVLPSRFVLAIKKADGGKEVLKARFLI